MKDHLRNIRATFCDLNGGHSLTSNEIQQTTDYFPFGREYFNFTASGTKEQQYKYNGKEYEDDVADYDYGARFYDPMIARWTTIDPLAEMNRRFSPYNYVEDNPIRNIDPDGMMSTIPGADGDSDDDVIERHLQAVAEVSQAAAGASQANSKISTDDDKKKAQKKKQEDAAIHNIRGGPIGANMTAEERAEYNKESGWALAGWLAGEGLGYLAKPFLKPVATWLGRLFGASSEASSTVFTVTAHEGDLFFYSTKVGDHVIEFGGNITKTKDVLTIKNFDIDGQLTNKLGISGLKKIITEFGKQQGVKEVIVEGAKRTTGANPGRLPSLLKFTVKP